MKTIGRDFGDTARKVYAVASGALGNGVPVAVKSDGTVSQIDGDIIGTTVTYESGAASDNSMTYDTSNDKVVIAYKDGGNSNHGTAVVGTVSGTSISFGTPVVFESAAVRDIGITFDSNSNKVVIAYRDDGNSSYGTAIIGTVSGTSISFGTAVVYESASSQYNFPTFDSNSNKVVISYTDNGDSGKGKAVVGTVSGTGISFGSIVVFNNGNTARIAGAFDSSSNKVVIAYQDEGNSNRGTAIVGTVSGTNISFGSEVVFETATVGNMSATFDSSSNKIVIGYSFVLGDSEKGKAIVGTVSNTSISFGTAVEFSSTAIDALAITFDTTANKVVINFEDSGDSNKGKFVVGEVSGTSISFGSPVIYAASVNADDQAVTYDPDANRIILSYRDVTNSEVGRSLVVKIGTAEALTSENYIGITPSAYPDGAGAEIQTKGAVNEEQSGLTAGQSYFVQTDGTLGTTAGDPSVFAGTAVSATKIIVKG